MDRTFKVYGILRFGDVAFPGYWRTGLSDRDVIRLRSKQQHAVNELSDTPNVKRYHKGIGHAYQAHHGRHAAYHDSYSFTNAGERCSFSLYIVEE